MAGLRVGNIPEKIFCIIRGGFLAMIVRLSLQLVNRLISPFRIIFKYVDIDQ